MMGIRDLFKKKKKKEEYDEFGFGYDFLERTDEYNFDNKKPRKSEPAWKKNNNPYSFAKYLDTIEDVQRKKITSLTTKEKIIVGITIILITYLLLALRGLVPIF